MSNMERKRVSFKIAKALKDVGYPQEGCDEYFNKYGAIDFYLGYNIARPYIMEVWLWLWREKKICINCNYDKYNMPPMWWCNNEDRINYNVPNFEDPEDAITNAIEFLVDNDLIK